jgi:hypothetical protein
MSMRRFTPILSGLTGFMLTTVAMIVHRALTVAAPFI